MLLTVIATLPVLAALALAILSLKASVLDNWLKVSAALRGESLRASAVAARPVTVRFSGRTRAVAPLRAEPRWRAAA